MHDKISVCEEIDIYGSKKICNVNSEVDCTQESILLPRITVRRQRDCIGYIVLTSQEPARKK
jgi:hypothetical protein